MQLTFLPQLIPKRLQSEVHCVLVLSARTDTQAVEVVIDLLTEHPQDDGVGCYQHTQEEDVFVFAQVGPVAPEPDGERGEQTEHEREAEEADVEHRREVIRVNMDVDRIVGDELPDCQTVAVPCAAQPNATEWPLNCRGNASARKTEANASGNTVIVKGTPFLKWAAKAKRP